MKKFLILCSVALVFISCGKDEESCTTDSFLGTWTGSETCLGLNTQNVAITITGSGNNLVIDGGSYSNEAVTRDDCSFKGGLTILGVGEVITGSVSADAKTLTITSTAAGVTTCTATLTK